jgi:hypothetical protein
MSSPFDVILVDAPCTRDREREIGFSTANSFAIRGEALKVGLETSYQNVSHPGARNEAKNLFELGPSCTIKPSPHTRLDLAPLFGVTSDSPHWNYVLVVFAAPRFCKIVAENKEFFRTTLEFGSEAGRAADSPEGGSKALQLSFHSDQRLIHGTCSRKIGLARTTAYIADACRARKVQEVPCFCG